MKKQQGVAAIILVLILIPLFGSVFFALEGTRYIQKKTRLADASEAAALAVTDENPKGLNIAESELDQKENLKSYESKSGLANLYINHYIKNINNENIIITPKLYINNNVQTLEENPSYYQYNIKTITNHKSWFFSDLIPSFKRTQSIQEQSLARNYPKLTKDQPMDIVFVADFSYSMNYCISNNDYEIKKQSKDLIKNCINNGNNRIYCITSSYNNSCGYKKTRIESLKETINSITNKYSKTNNKNRFAIVPYGLRTIEVKNNKEYCSTQLRYKKESKYNDINWNTWVYISSIDAIKSIYNKKYQKKIKENLNNNSEFEKNYYSFQEALITSKETTKNDIINFSCKNEGNCSKHSDGLIRPDPTPYIDIDNTLNNLFNFIDNKNNVQFETGRNKLFQQTCDNKSFYTIPLTTIKNSKSTYTRYKRNNFKITVNNDFNEKIINMIPGGNTGIYEGIIRGAQILNDGNPKNNKKDYNVDKEYKKYKKRLKIIIFITDGEEWPYTTTFEKLVDNGLCKNIISHFTKDNNKFYMGMVGIGYKPEQIHAFKKCVGSSNIMSTNGSGNELTTKIENLIYKGQQENGITKLSDGQN